jgi:hypothetical protein
VQALIILAVATYKVGDPLTFYAVAATVIPVLYLALIYQSQVIERVSKGSPEAKLLNGWLSLGYALLGEASSLHVLSTQHPTQLTKGLTTVSLITLTVWLGGAQLLEAFADEHATAGFRVQLAILTGGLALLILAGLWGVEAFT